VYDANSSPSYGSYAQFGGRCIIRRFRDVSQLFLGRHPALFTPFTTIYSLARAGGDKPPRLPIS